MSKYVCRTIVEFHLDEEKHSIAYSKAADELLRYLNSPGNARYFLAESAEDAEQKGRTQIQSMLKSPVRTYDPTDFTFQIFTSDIEDGGYFWSMPNTTNCRDYPVADPKPCESH
jgi:hypothetical protein